MSAFGSASFDGVFAAWGEHSFQKAMRAHAFSSAGSAAVVVFVIGHFWLKLDAGRF